MYGQAATIAAVCTAPLITTPRTASGVSEEGRKEVGAGPDMAAHCVECESRLAREIFYLSPSLLTHALNLLCYSLTSLPTSLCSWLMHSASLLPYTSTYYLETNLPTMVSSWLMH